MFFKLNTLKFRDKVSFKSKIFKWNFMCSIIRLLCLCYFVTELPIKWEDFKLFQWLFVVWGQIIKQGDVDLVPYSLFESYSWAPVVELLLDYTTIPYLNLKNDNSRVKYIQAENMRNFLSWILDWYTLCKRFDLGNTVERGKGMSVNYSLYSK